MFQVVSYISWKKFPMILFHIGFYLNFNELNLRNIHCLRIGNFYPKKYHFKILKHYIYKRYFFLIMNTQLEGTKWIIERNRLNLYS